MISELISNINTIIINSTMINRYGGYSTFDQKDGKPFGKSLQKDCFGNTYSFDSRFETTGFLSLQPPRIEYFNVHASKGQFVFELHLFNNIKISGDGQRFYNKALSIISHLKRHYDNVRMEVRQHPEPLCEYAVIFIRLDLIIPCDYEAPDLEPLCEGQGLYDVPFEPQPTIYPKNLNTWLQSSTNFDVSIIPINLQNPRKLDTVAIRYNDGIGYYTYSGTGWNLNYFIAFSAAVISKYQTVITNQLTTITAAIHGILNPSRVDAFDQNGNAVLIGYSIISNDVTIIKDKPESLSVFIY